ncbi:hypothetical protein KKH18_03935, partial [bacterium]|nr:hypothetical protein [bacterium]
MRIRHSGMLFIFVVWSAVAAMPPEVVIEHEFSERGTLVSVLIDDALSPSESITMAGTSTFGVSRYFLQNVGFDGTVNWSHAWGNSDRCYSMARASDSTALLIGWNFSQGEVDYRIMHTDWEGALHGNNSFGETLSDEYGHAIQELVPDSFVVTGLRRIEGVSDLSLLLIDIDGEVYREWSYGPARSGSVIEPQGDSLIWVYGVTDSLPEAKQDFLMLRTSAAEFGAGLFTRHFGGAEDEILYDAVRIDSSLTILVGSTRSFSAAPVQTDIWVVATNDNGDSLWSRSWGGSRDDAALSVLAVADNDSGFVIAGYRSVDSSGVHNALLMKINQDGDSLWSIVVEDTIRSEFNDVAVDSSYRYYAVGVSQPAAEYGFYLMTDPDPAAPIEHPPNPFALLTPAADDTLFEGNIVFTWEEAVDPDPGDQIVYALLMDSDTLFESPMAIGPLMNETYTWITDTDNVFIHWRVAAQDIAGNLTVCSDRHRTFLRVFPDSTLPFSLIAPEDDEVLTSPTAEFRWERAVDTDLSDEVSYDLVFEVRDTSFAIVGLADTFVTIDLLNNPIIMQSDTVQWHVVANSYLPPMSLASRELWTFVNWNEAVSQIPEIASSFGLGMVYPNPFNSSTTITYDVDAIADVRLEVFSIEGRLVETLVAAERWPGRYTARWNGTSNGYAAGSGTYF